jgi:hypothetical protein
VPAGPLTLLVMGTTIGTRSVLFPMSVMATFVIGRIVEQNLVSVDPGVIEAARAMGASRFRIVWSVLVTVTVDAAGRYHASFVVEVPDQALPLVQHEVGNRRGADPLRGAVGRAEGRRPADRAEGRGEAPHRAARVGPPPARVEQPREGAGRSPALTCASRTPAGTGCTRCRPRSSARTKRCTWKTSPCRAWPVPGWPAACTTRARARRVGHIGQAKPLHVRTWTCGCGATHDRDVNAARNILAAGRAVQPVEPMSAGTPVPQSAVKQEPTGSTA